MGQIEEIIEDMSNYVKIENFFKFLQDNGVSMRAKEIKQHERNKKKKKRGHVHQGNNYYGKIYSLLQLVYQVYRKKPYTFANLPANSTNCIHYIGKYILAYRYKKQEQNCMMSPTRILKNV